MKYVFKIQSINTWIKINGHNGCIFTASTILIFWPIRSALINMCCEKLWCNTLSLKTNYFGYIIRAVVPKLFIVPYPFKHSTCSCITSLAPGSAHSQMLFFCHHCKPDTYTLYDTFIKHKDECEFFHNLACGKWQRPLIGPGHK